MADKSKEDLKHLNIPLSGKLRTAPDGTQLGPGDFKVLENMRYGELSPKSVSGMDKINTTRITGYYPVRGAFHYRKDQPAESHVLVQTWNDVLINGSYKVYQNITPIPTAGNHETTALFTDSSGAGIGRFSDAPDNCVAYANGKDACIWGGDEYRVAGFVIGDLEGNTNLDYTLKINNTLTDAANIATMVSVTEGVVDTNTMLLMHLDDDVTDSSPTTPHTPVNTGVTFTNAVYKFVDSGLFDGTTSFIRVPDDPDFTFSSGTWTIDYWIYIDPAAGTAFYVYCHQLDGSDVSYFRIYMNKSGGLYRVYLTCYAASVSKVLLATPYSITTGAWHHIEISENGNDYRIFIDGVSSNNVEDTDRPGSNYNSDVYIGCAYSFAGGTTLFFKGYLDEFRVSNICRHTEDFTPRSTVYGPQTVCYLYVGSTIPISGVKFYVGTVHNESAATATAYYWGNGVWNAVPATFLDGTSSGGTDTLGQDGIISFGTTTSLAKPKLLNDTYCYWYQFAFVNIDATTTISHATLVADFQQVKDLWDGEYRPIASFNKYTTKWIDNTTNVLNEDWVAPAVDDTTAMSGSLTYSQIGGLTSSQYLLCGFVERMTGLNFKFVQAGFGATSIDRTNTAACAMTISYWDGDSWVIVTGLDDGTRQGTASFGKSGVITWDSTTENTEFKYSIHKNVDHFYYYKISFDATLSALVFIDKVSGISAQKYINGYSFPVMWQNRLWLFDDVGNKRNSGICTSQDTICVFNGADAYPPEAPIVFGNNEKVVAADTLYARDGGSVYDNLIVYKARETWVIDGTSPTDYKKRKMGDTGCVAPGTLKKINTGYELSPGILHHIHIFQSDHGIHLNDGSSIQIISDDIRDVFDQNATTHIYLSMIHKSEAFVDEKLYEYHWLWASGESTVLDKEYVYDIRKKKWFTINRTSGKYIQLGISVRDTNGNSYNYGFIDTGFMERLEYGTTFDTTTIVSTFQTGDIALGDWRYSTKIRKIKHIVKAKATTTQSVTITHYGDTSSTATMGSPTHAVLSSAKRVLQKICGVDWGNFVFHSIKCSITTNNENVAYEPIGLMLKYRTIHDEEF